MGVDERVVGLLQQARRQLELERQRHSAPIAIVGIGCRFPAGASSPEAFWQLLRQGVDASRPIPVDRWDHSQHYDPDPEQPGKTYVQRGSFLDAIDGFEPEFFGISPREALGMDPQQRLLLEVSWEALEDAGIPRDRVQGTATGVWLGLCTDDYARRSVSSGDLTLIDPYTALGSARSVTAGRVAYFFDLRGPVIQLDTACSSSLVAIHQACQSLRAGETNLALVGGINLMSSPEPTIALSKLGVLSRDGRCRTFDAAADGYGRGEGCGMVVLKRLVDAQQAGDRIYAVIRGSAVNHNGHGNGITAPRGLAQEAVIRAALADARVDPSVVDYVEAQGTATLLGDPLEVLSLNRVYAQNRAVESPLYLGSVKTNLGHLEAAAGIAGLIKTALCVSRGEMVASLHFDRPNPKIPWDTLSVKVATRCFAWPDRTHPRTAGTSAFGMNGTNAHVVLEEAPSPAAVTPIPQRRAELVLLSAMNAPALVAVARRLKRHLKENPGIELPALAYSLATTRSLLRERLALCVATRAELEGLLTEVAESAALDGTLSITAGRGSDQVAFLFTGDGYQAGMGHELSQEWPVFRNAVQAAREALGLQPPAPPKSSLTSDPGVPPRTPPDLAPYPEAASFVLGWALAALWRSWGIEPDLMAGRSVGQITAACVAGVFSLSDAARLVRARGEIFLQAPPASKALEQLGHVAQSIQYHPPRMRLLATLGQEPTEPGYWVRQASSLGDSPQQRAALVAAGAQSVIELGPGDGVYELAANPEDEPPAYLPSLRTGQPEARALLESLGSWIARGGDVDWSSVFPTGGRRVALPTYPWQRQTFWLGRPASTAQNKASREPVPMGVRIPHPREVVPVGHSNVGCPLARADFAPLPQADRLAVINDIVQAELRRVLGLASPDALVADRHFSEFGLDSLMAVELANALTHRLGVSLSPTLAFDHQTLRALSEYLVGLVETRFRADGTPAIPGSGEDAFDANLRHAPRPNPIRRVTERGTYPTTDAQQRLWFGYRVAPGDPVYNQGLQLRIRGVLHVDALQRSVRQVLARHEAFKSRFRTDADGRLVQWVDEASESTLVYWDLSGSPESESALFAWIRREERLPFDLESGPVLRCNLLRTSHDTHVLALTCHHILIDGWSLGQLISEIAQTYVSLIRSEQPPDSPVALHMGDYACWERQIANERRHVPETHIVETLAALPPPALPRCTDDGAVQDANGSICHFELPVHLGERLRALAARHHVTLNSVLLTSFALLLSHYTGQRRFVLGTIVANRTHPTQQAIVGLLANTMLVDCNFEGNPSVELALARIQSEVQRTLAHSWQPMSQLLATAGDPAALLGQSARLAAVFSYQGIFASPSWSQEQSTWELCNRNNLSSHIPGTAKADLWLSLYPWHEGTLGGSLEFRTEVFGPAYAARFVEHYQALLESITQRSGPVLELPLLCRMDYEAWQRWNVTDAEYPRQARIHELFEQTTREYPTAIALSTAEKHTTYAELDQRADAIVEHLRRAGVGHATKVAICIERSVDLIAGLLAILKVRATYVPLDPEFPANRVSFMLQDSKSSVVLSHSSVDGSTWPCAIQRINLDRLDSSALEPDDRSRLARKHGPVEANPALDDELLYVIYTSGSTGQPKGVCVKHQAVINLLSSIKNSLQFNRHDVLLAVTTVSFDIAALEIFLPLVTGARIELADAAEARDVERLQQRIEHRGVTVMQATPSSWQMFRAAGIAPNPRLRVLCGGEALPPDLASWLVTRCAAVWNVYGPTETTIWSTAYRLGRDLTSGVLIGSPLANTQVHVFDDGGRRVPIGVPGELYISGDGLAVGYLDRPELTAAKFVTKSWLGGACAMYRTGDRVRYRWDGELEYLGRLDDQVKVRGFRIELGEIEATLLTHVSIVQGVCAVRDIASQPSIVAYVVAASGQRVEDAELLQHLQQTLPAYMLPAAVVWLEQLPLTANGKVDRKALPAPSSPTNTEVTYLAPANELEHSLCRLWEEILETERVGVEDDFFRLGGDSLKSVRLQVKASRLNLAFSIRDVFEARTVRALAQRMALGGRAERQTRERLQKERHTRLRAAVKLADSVRVRPGAAPAGQASLLTGATGFLGAHLLHALSLHDDGPVYALVRERDERAARNRLEQSLAQYGLATRCLERVTCIVGDLEQPELGMPQELWDNLGARIKHIYHSAATVNHLLDFASLESANINGLEQVLRLAAQGGGTLHFISTMDVFDSTQYATGSTIREDAPVPVPRRASGYAQSKWVGEQIIDLAVKRGIACQILRLPLLTGHSDSGSIPRQRYWLTQAIRAMWLTGQLPEWPNPLQLVPVDYAASAIVGIGHGRNVQGAAFHVVHPEELRVSDLPQVFASLGREVHTVEMGDWLKGIQHFAQTRQDQGLHYLNAFLLGVDALSLATKLANPQLRFDRSNTDLALTEQTLPLPGPLQLIKATLTFLKRAGLLGADASAASELE